jgi:hypothetical protein
MQFRKHAPMKQHPKRLLDPHGECLCILDKLDQTFSGLLLLCQEVVGKVAWESGQGRLGGKRSGNRSETRFLGVSQA